MSSIAATALPSPARVEWDAEDVVRQSQRGGILHHYEPDPQLRPRSCTLHYERALAPVADAIRRHFREHPHEAFDWTPPGEADPIRVMHAAPPNIAWDSAIAATCQVYLEESLAYD